MLGRFSFCDLDLSVTHRLGNTPVYDEAVDGSLNQIL